MAEVAVCLVGLRDVSFTRAWEGGVFEVCPP